MVALIDNQHPVGRLNEIIRLNIAEQESRGPRWPAACAWAERFIRQRTLVVLPHAFPRPWQQYGTVQITNWHRRLTRACTKIVIGDERVGGIFAHRAGSAFGRLKALLR